jgi:hypothetical protein
LKLGGFFLSLSLLTKFLLVEVIPIARFILKNIIFL